MARILTSLVTAISLAALLPACSDDAAAGPDGSTDADTDADADSDADADADGGADTDGSASIAGSAQKGPFVIGSTIEIAMLDASGATTGVVFNENTEDSLGNFEVATNRIGLGEIIGSGYYFNEIANRLSTGQLTLRAVLDIEEGEGQVAYLNAFTHLSSGRALALLAGGTAFDDAVAQAEDELYAALGILHPDPANRGRGTSMDLTGADSPDNEYLMAVSCILDAAAALDAVDEAEVDGKLQLLVNSIRSDLEDDGDISEELEEKLRSAEASLNPNAECVANLAVYIEEQTGSAPALPDPDQACDNDDDGIPNAADDDIDGDGVPNGPDEAPYDPAVGNGVYVDAATGLAWQLAPPPAVYEWADAGPYCDALDLGGFDDWRLPTISELRTLVVGCEATETGGACGVTDDCTGGACWDESCYSCQYAEGPAGGCYWPAALGTSCLENGFFSSNELETENRWAVLFGSAEVFSASIETLVGETMSVRCVRAEAAPDAGP